MELSTLILPQNICRTCLAESDSSTFMSVHDLIEHEMNKIKLIDILIFLNCVEVSIQKLIDTGKLLLK